MSRTVRAAATPAKQSWLPGTPIPAYLEDLPAAYGFDPLRLGTNSGALRWCAHPLFHTNIRASCEPLQKALGGATFSACNTDDKLVFQLSAMALKAGPKQMYTVDCMSCGVRYEPYHTYPSTSL